MTNEIVTNVEVETSVSGEALQTMLNLAMEMVTERVRQDEKWKQQNHSPSIWYHILGEEVGEVGRAINDLVFVEVMCIENLMNYRDELIQVAAVAMAAVESLDRNEMKRHQEKLIENINNG